MAGATDAGGDDRSRRRGGDHVVDSTGDDGGSGGDGVVGSLGVSCSICLEMVADDGSRSRAKLQCGHEFHLDCIGSAFNMKGAMQCPNCRKVEKGQWLYANGSTRPFPEFVMEDWIPDEDLYGLSYPEMHYRVHWCPVGELSQTASSFEELESPTTTYHEYRGQHAIFAEHTAASSVAHSYLAYVGSLPAIAPRTGDNVDDNPWNNLSGQTENFNQRALSIPYIGWDHHSPSFPLPSGHVIAADLVPSETDASTRPRSHPHPFLFGFRSSQRTASAIHRHPGSSTQTHERVYVSHPFHPQQQASNAQSVPSPLIPLARRGMPAPPPLPPEQNSGFFIFPPLSSSSQSMLEPENERFHAWERDWFSHFPVSSRDSGWGSSHHRPASSFWHRHFS